MKASLLEIDIATTAEANNLKQISDSIEQISDVVHTNSATSEENAAASEEFSSQAAALHGEMLTFKI